MLHAIVILCIFIAGFSAYAETSNSTHTTLSENVTLSDSATTQTPPPDMGMWLAASGIGIALGFIYNSSKSLQKLRQAYLKKSEKKDWKDTPYDDNVFGPLELLAGKLNKIYPAIIMIYVILLAFVVSDKAVLAYTNWYFVIWCGWILAIIVRTGTVMMMLFDISKEDPIETTKRNIYAAREFFKHSLYLLVPTVAFLPAFFISSIPTAQMIKEPWQPWVSILSAGVAIIFLFLIFYRISLKIQEYAKEGGAGHTYFIVIILIGFGATAAYYPESSPISPMLVTLWKSSDTYVIPTILYVVSLGGTAFFLWMISVYYNSISVWMDRKIKKVKRDHR